MADGYTGKTAVDFEPFNENALADEFEGGDFLQNSVESGLVECNSVDGLVLDLSLGPLLFLCGLASAGGCCCFFGSLERTNQ